MKKIIAIIAVIALMAVLGTVLFACVPANADKAKAKLEKAGYTVSVEDIDADMAKLAKMDGAQKSIEAYKEAEKEEDSEYVMAILFDSAKNAKAYFNDNKDDIKKMGEDVEDFEYGQSGKWVYGGTKAAVKAFKK